ncbi:unnamed protein product [Sphenostylis stenocarpa]|uniref:Ribosomal protein/NADH dehydrogenase domain-containing protein n=1 Tax=Sphenostylis stenocarpa TaxID=92480 RepID=A0AA86VTK0_9FABA|nr:unnamed protein product [Sphenostylis stenocarpa]
MPPKKGNQSKPERLADKENMEARVSSMENEVAQMRITMESFQEALKREVQENHSILVELLTRNAGKDLEGEDEGSVKRKSVSNKKKHSGVASGLIFVLRFCLLVKFSVEMAFMESHLPAFKEKNPQLEVVTELIRENKNQRVICVKNMDPEDIHLHATRLRNALGRKVVKLRTRHVTKHPSVQGTWTTSLEY